MLASVQWVKGEALWASTKRPNISMVWADVLQAKTAKEVNHTVELGTEARFYSLLDTLRKGECRFGDTVRVATSQFPLELNVTIHGETKAHLRRSMVWT